MSKLNSAEELVHRLMEPGPMSSEDQESLESLLSSPEGRQLWVKEWRFQADLIDSLKMEQEHLETQTEKTDIHRRLQRGPLSKGLKLGGWISLAALLMIAFFMSYYINGIPVRANHTSLGKVVAVFGDVHLNREPININLVENMNFKEGDKILSSSKGWVVFEYEDGSLITVGPNSRMAFATKKQRLNEGWSIGLEKGSLDAEVQKQTSVMRLKTASMGVEVLGTEFSLLADETSQKLELFEGKLAVHSLLKGGNEQRFLLSEGQLIMATQNKLNLEKIKPQPWLEVVVLKEMDHFLLVQNKDGSKSLLRHDTVSVSNAVNIDHLNNKNNHLNGQVLKIKVEGQASPRIIDIELLENL